MKAFILALLVCLVLSSASTVLGQSGTNGCFNSNSNPNGLRCPAGTACFSNGVTVIGGPNGARCCPTGQVGCGRPGGINIICINPNTQSCCVPAGTAQVTPIACGRDDVCRQVSSTQVECVAPTGNPTCFGVPATSSSVCSGAGRCVANNLCSCSCGRAGDRCEIAICFGKISFDPNVCSGHGGCPRPDTCVCNPGFTGINCQTRTG